MAITDDILNILNSRKQDTQTLQSQSQEQQQPSGWVQNLIDSHAAAVTGGKIQRKPVGFNFQRDPFDPSSYYNQLGQIKNISTAATAVVNQEVANKQEQERQAQLDAIQRESQGALQGVSPNYTYTGDTQYGGTSRKYHLKGVAGDVASAADYWGSKYGIRTIYGLGPGSVPGSDHPKGLALDYMINNTKNGKGRGTSLANDVIQNYKAWNVKYVIWYHYIWSPSKGWRRYHGPSPHTDHVHVSFNS